MHCPVASFLVYEYTNYFLLPFPSLKPKSEPAAVEDVLYCRVDVPPGREQRTDVLRRVREAHVLQLL